MRAAIFDLDGTLADISHRLHHVQGRRKDWDAFFAGIPEDRLNMPVAHVLDAFARARSAAIVLCSGRPERCRRDTEAWLALHEVPYEALYMRSDNDTRPDHIVKAEMLEQVRAAGFEPVIVIDDRQSVVDMWRDKGLTCLQCAPDQLPIPEAATLTLMVGPTGGGKSTWLARDEAAHDRFSIRPSHVISSDEVRAELCGDWRDQSRNAQVFAAIHAMAAARLKHGLPVVIDATHLRRRDRMGAAALSQGRCPVRYLVMNRPMDEKRRDGGWRNELAMDLIGRHEMTFNSQLKDILAGDGLSNVEVSDLRGSL